MNTIFMQGTVECDARVYKDNDTSLGENVYLVVSDREGLRLPVKAPRPYITNATLELLKAGAFVIFTGTLAIGNYVNQVNQGYHGLGIVTTDLSVHNREHFEANREKAKKMFEREE